MDINLLSETTASKLSLLIADAQHIVITCHKSPDGDALGASLAWADYLTQQCGKQVSVVVPDAYPDFLRWLPNSEKIIRYDRHHDEVCDLFVKADLVFYIDFNDASRVDEMEPVLTAATARRVMLDHHLNPTTEGMGHRSYRTTQVYLDSIGTSRINDANRQIIRRISM